MISICYNLATLNVIELLLETGLDMLFPHRFYLRTACLTCTRKMAEARRQRIIDLVNAQVPMVTIANIINVHKRMVERVRKSFKAGGTVKAAAPGSPAKRTAKFMDELKGMIEANPSP